MSKVNQEPTRPSRKYNGSTRIATRKLHNGYDPSDSAAISDSSVITLGPLASLQSCHSLSSKSSLSFASDISARSRPFRTFKASSPASPKKRTRLLPRAYKRGGRNKPIVVRESSSGEFQSPSMSSASSKEVNKNQTEFSNADVKEENEQKESQAGPAKALEELLQVNATILQSLGNHTIKVEKRKKRKKRKEPVQQKMPAPLCSSQELSIIYSPRFKEENKKSISTNSTLDQQAPPDIAAICKEGNPNNTTSKTLNTTCCDDKKGLTLGNEDDIFPKAILAEDDSNIEGRNQGANNNGAFDAIDSTGSSTANLKPNQAEIDSAKALMEPNDNICNAPTTTLDDRLLVDNKLAQANLPVVNASEAIPHYNALNTPQKLSTDTDIHVLQPSPPASSASRNQHTASTNAVFCKDELANKARLPGPLLNSYPTSSGSPSTHPISSLIDPAFVPPRLDVKKFLRVMNHADQPYFSDPTILERHLNHLRGDLDEGEVQEAASLASTENGSADIPRAWIDESRLEAQPANHLGNDTENMDVSVFDPVGTMHKFLDIVTFPLQYIWSKFANNG